MLKEVFMPVVIVKLPVNSVVDIGRPAMRVREGVVCSTEGGAMFCLEGLLQNEIKQLEVSPDRVYGVIEKRYQLED